MIKPNEVAEYLDKVRPIMDDIEVGNYVNIAGHICPFRVTQVNKDACLLTLEFGGMPYKTIRVEQIEYIHPY
jgi:hypothetical protein